MAAAVGQDPDLLRELRTAFIDSARRQVDFLRRSRCDANWHYSAMRLRGLGASFDNARLIALAEEAIDAAPGDPVVLRQLEQMLDALAES